MAKPQVGTELTENLISEHTLKNGIKRLWYEGLIIYVRQCYCGEKIGYTVETIGRLRIM
jgi:hypothetical protein